MDNAQLLVKINALTDRATKIEAEVRALIAAVQAGGQTSPEVDAAIAALEGRLATVDDLNTDAP